MFILPHRYTSVAVQNVQVTEGKATELNFTLTPVVSDAAASPTATTDMTSTKKPDTTTTTTTSTSSDTPQTKVVPPEGNENSSPSLPPERQPIQPQEFRHHSYPDMELFLRKYSTDFPSIVYLYSVGRSVKNRELYVMAISDNPQVHEHGRLWVVLTNRFLSFVSLLMGILTCFFLLR